MNNKVPPIIAMIDNITPNISFIIVPSLITPYTLLGSAL